MGHCQDDLAVYSVRLRRIPILGSVSRVEWRSAALDGCEESDALDLGPSVAEHLDNIEDIQISLIAADVDIEIIGASENEWAFIVKRRPVASWTRPDLDSVNAVANALLNAALPPDD